MITESYEFFAPTSVDEALSLLARHGDDAKVLAGGMTLVPIMTLGLTQPAAVVSLNHLSGLDQVQEETDSVAIGARATHHTLETHATVSSHFPLLSEAASSIGDPQIRHRGTLGGSLAHADPAADYPPVMLALGARFVLRSRSGERVVAAGDFFVDLLTTALRADELLTEIRIPKLEPGTGTAATKLHRVEGSFGIVTAAATISGCGRRGKLAVGGVAPIPVLIDLDSHLVEGPSEAAHATIASEVWERSADASPDLTASVEYKRSMARVMARRVIDHAVERAGAKGGQS